MIGIAVEHAALDYRMADDPKYRELAVVKEGADEYSRYYQVPQNGDDLLKRSALIAASTREGATLVVLIKEIGTDALLALRILVSLAAAGKPEYRERIDKYYRDCRDNDLAVAVAQTDVKGDRALGPTQQEHPDYYVRIVEERPDRNRGARRQGPHLGLDQHQRSDRAADACDARRGQGLRGRICAADQHARPQADRESARQPAARTTSSIRSARGTR